MYFCKHFICNYLIFLGSTKYKQKTEDELNANTLEEVTDEFVKVQEGDFPNYEEALQDLTTISQHAKILDDDHFEALKTQARDEALMSPSSGM